MLLRWWISNGTCVEVMLDRSKFSIGKTSRLMPTNYFPFGNWNVRVKENIVNELGKFPL